MQGLPENGSSGSVAMYACALVAMNSLGTWAAPACNNPAFAEIVPPHMRNIVFAFDRCFEGAVAACAAPLVGALAEKRFGFKVSVTMLLHVMFVPVCSPSVCAVCVSACCIHAAGGDDCEEVSASATGTGGRGGGGGGRAAR